MAFFKDGVTIKVHLGEKLYLCKCKNESLQGFNN